MTLALYRTYRPGRLADVVGQEHVTIPLARALERDRVHHAYLFSGPRGCGKTSSARILARSLNCVQGPTPEPCGECQSCQDLSPNGPGSLDVIEIDAATHGLVDDARELRQQAHFSPASSRYKVYIIDEAHQLGPGAANALLKIIEEPPSHLKFVFATTASDKILGTIRSRTHHYPFRLVPARVLQQHLGWVCEQEGIVAEPAALALITRAAGGSVRDALSILGQLAAGAGPAGITRDETVALLGFTDDAVLERVLDSLTAHDAERLFAAADDVLESGHDPRRFLTDLLEYARDLILVSAAPEAASSGLVEVSADRAESMQAQATALGSPDLLAIADILDVGITGMKGATPTRLQLELVMARLLLRESSAAGANLPSPPAATRPGPPSSRSGSLVPPSGTPTASPPIPLRSEPADAQPATVPPAGPSSSAVPEGSPASSPGTTGPTSSGHPRSLAEVRQLWPEVLERLREIRRVPWSFISQNTEVLDVAEGAVTLSVTTARLRDQLVGREDFVGPLRQALADVLDGQWRVEAVVSGAPTGAAIKGSRSPSTSGRSPAQPADGGGSRLAAEEASAQRTGASAVTHEDSADGGDEDVSPDDRALDDVSQEELLSRELGASVIEVAPRR